MPLTRRTHTDVLTFLFPPLTFLFSIVQPAQQLSGGRDDAEAAVVRL